jgi:dTDP-glucose pyrophosphorylase
VRNPKAYGVVFDARGNAIGIEEKPRNPRSQWALTGLYFYDNAVTEIAAGPEPSARVELEITDLNNVYLERGLLTVERLGHGWDWFDTGSHQSLIEAASLCAQSKCARASRSPALRRSPITLGISTASVSSPSPGIWAGATMGIISKVCWSTIRDGHSGEEPPWGSI